MIKEIQRYRLRDNNRIVGYAEQSKNGVQFTSKYPLFWENEKNSYSYVDKAVGVLDRMNRMIFEFDIVMYKITDTPIRREGVILWSEEQNAFGIYDLSTFHFTRFYFDDINLFQNERMEIISHLFNHPDLEERILNH